MKKSLFIFLMFSFSLLTVYADPLPIPIEGTQNPQIEKTTQPQIDTRPIDEIKNEMNDVQKKDEEATPEVQPKKTVTTINKPVYDYNFGMTYEEAIESDKPTIVLFYTNWCGACKRVLPIIRSAQKKWLDTYNFVSINAEDPKYKTTLVKDYRLRCFPTLYIIDTKYDNRVHLEVSYIFQLPILEQELSRYQRIRTLLDK